MDLKTMLCYVPSRLPRRALPHRPEWGGSQIRPEATGYGAVFFAQNILKDQGKTLTVSEALWGEKCCQWPTAGACSAAWTVPWHVPGDPPAAAAAASKPPRL